MKEMLIKRYVTSQHISKHKYMSYKKKLYRNTSSIYHLRHTTSILITATALINATAPPPSFTEIMSYWPTNFQVFIILFILNSCLLLWLSLIIHFKIPRLFPDFPLTFHSFPYPLTDKKIIFILYFNGANLGVILKGKNLLPEGANTFH